MKDINKIFDGIKESINNYIAEYYVAHRGSSDVLHECFSGLEDSSEPSDSYGLPDPSSNANESLFDSDFSKKQGFPEHFNESSLDQFNNVNKLNQVNLETDMLSGFSSHDFYDRVISVLGEYSSRFAGYQKIYFLRNNIPPEKANNYPEEVSAEQIVFLHNSHLSPEYVLNTKLSNSTPTRLAVTFLVDIYRILDII